MGICLLDVGQALLIDSGGDKDAGKKALKHLEANGWTLAGVFNTHSHADHIRGSKLIVERTGLCTGNRKLVYPLAGVGAVLPLRGISACGAAQ